MIEMNKEIAELLELARKSYSNNQLDDLLKIYNEILQKEKELNPKILSEIYEEDIFIEMKELFERAKTPKKCRHDIQGNMINDDKYIYGPVMEIIQDQYGKPIGEKWIGWKPIARIEDVPYYKQQINIQCYECGKILVLIKSKPYCERCKKYFTEVQIRENCGL